MAIEGTTVRLREERADDVDFVTALRNDLDTQAWPKSLPPHYTREMMAKRYEAREFSFDPDEGRFIIEEIETGDRVGFVGYMGLEPRFSASIGVMRLLMYKNWRSLRDVMICLSSSASKSSTSANCSTLLN